MALGVYRGPPEVYRGPCMKNMCWNSPIISTYVRGYNVLTEIFWAKKPTAEASDHRVLRCAGRSCTPECRGVCGCERANKKVQPRCSWNFFDTG